MKPSSSPCPARRPIAIRVLWGNDDVEATLKVTRGQWAAIVAGELFAAGTWSWYEGKRQRAVFSFNDPEPGDLNVGGEEMAEYYVGRIGDAEILGAEYPGPPDARA
jgi:hypothetical protein